MSRWFRFYDDSINHPKVLRMPLAMRWHWVSILCLASKNDGVIPCVEDICAVLHMTAAKVRAILDDLIKRTLIDVNGTTLTPHDWNGRQYKSDVSTDRVKRFRERERNVSVTPPETEADTDSESDTKQIDDDDGGARARLLSDAAFEVATEIGKLCGYAEPLDWPPQWAGAPMRVQTWLNTGWPRDMIVTACHEAVGKKRDGPPSSINYFEKPIASFIAKQSQPLPQVNLIEGETINVVRQNGKPGIIETQQKLIDHIEGLGPRPNLIRSEAGGNPVRLLPAGGSERPGDVHDGNNGDPV